MRADRSKSSTGLGPLPRAHGPDRALQAQEVVVDERGRIAEMLRDGSPGAFAPITRVREHGDLRLGSCRARCKQARRHGAKALRAGAVCLTQFSDETGPHMCITLQRRRTEPSR